MKHYKTRIIILFLVIISSGICGACSITSTVKSATENKKVLKDLNLLRVKLQKKTLQIDSIIDKNMAFIANIPNYDNLDSLRNTLRERGIYDYNVCLMKFKRNNNISTLESDLKANYPDIMKTISDSEYNKVGIHQKENEIFLLFVKSYMSVELSEVTIEFKQDVDGTVINKPLYVTVSGKTTKKLYYKILENSNEERTNDKSLIKSDGLQQDDSRFTLRLNPDVNWVEFVDENDSILYIYKVR